MAGRVSHRDPSDPRIAGAVAFYDRIIAEAMAGGGNAILIDKQVFTLAQLQGMREDLIKFGDSEFWQWMDVDGNWFGWNVTAAIEIVNDGRSANDAIPLTPEFLSFLRVDDADSEERIAKADITIPGIGVPFYQRGVFGAVFIDGSHRAHKAYRCGLTEYPAHMLTWEEAKSIRMSGCPWEIQDTQQQKDDKVR